MPEPKAITTNLKDVVDALIGAHGYFVVLLDRDKSNGLVQARSFVNAADTLDFFTMMGTMQHRIAVQGTRYELQEGDDA